MHKFRLKVLVCMCERAFLSIYAAESSCSTAKQDATRRV